MNKPMLGTCKECLQKFEKPVARAQICSDCKEDRENDKHDQWLENWRFKFAGMAMQGLISTLTIGRTENMDLIAQTAREYADAMIVELSKEEKPAQEALPKTVSCL